MVKGIYILFDKDTYKEYLSGCLKKSAEHTLKHMKALSKCMFFMLFISLIMMLTFQFGIKLKAIAFASYAILIWSSIYFLVMDIVLSRVLMDKMDAIEDIQSLDFSWELITKVFKVLNKDDGIYLSMVNILLTKCSFYLGIDIDTLDLHYKDKPLSKSHYARYLIGTDILEHANEGIMLLQQGEIKFCSHFNTTQHEYYMYYTTDVHGNLIMTEWSGRLTSVKQYKLGGVY